MVDTPKGSDNEEHEDGTKDQSLEKQSKRRRKRRPKPRLDTDPAIEQDEPADDEHALEQPSEQSKSDKEAKQPVPGENGIPDDLTPDKPTEQKNLHKRLVATAHSLKKQKRKLKTGEDALRIRWSKVINTADKYGGSRHTKSYPKRKLLPEFDEEAVEPPQSKKKNATRSDRRPHGQHRAANGAAHKPACDPLNDSHQKDGPTRSIYGTRKQALISNATQLVSERHGTPRYRGAVSPMRFWT